MTISADVARRGAGLAVGHLCFFSSMIALFVYSLSFPFHENQASIRIVHLLRTWNSDWHGVFSNCLKNECRNHWLGIFLTDQCIKIQHDFRLHRSRLATPVLDTPQEERR